MSLPQAVASVPQPPSFTLRHPSDESTSSGTSDATLVEIYESYARRPSYHAHRSTYASSMAAYHGAAIPMRVPRHRSPPPPATRVLPRDVVLYDTETDVASLRQHCMAAWRALCRLWCL